MIEIEVFQRTNKFGKNYKLSIWYDGVKVYNGEFSNIERLKELRDELAREIAWLDDYLAEMK